MFLSVNFFRLVFQQMEPEYGGASSHSTGNDILVESLTVACIGDSEFVQPVDLAEDQDSRWAPVSQHYEIMNE